MRILPPRLPIAHLWRHKRRKRLLLHGLLGLFLAALLLRLLRVLRVVFMLLLERLLVVLLLELLLVLEVEVCLLSGHCMFRFCMLLSSCVPCSEVGLICCFSINVRLLGNSFKVMYLN